MSCHRINIRTLMSHKYKTSSNKKSSAISNFSFYRFSWYKHYRMLWMNNANIRKRYVEREKGRGERTVQSCVVRWYIFAALPEQLSFFIFLQYMALLVLPRVCVSLYLIVSFCLSPLFCDSIAFRYFCQQYIYIYIFIFFLFHHS